MPTTRTRSAVATTTTRARSGTRAAAAIARPTGQLVWAGAPPGGKSYELFQAASGWQMYLLNNVGGVITRTLIKATSPELMTFFQSYLMQHPPTALRNRSVARSATNAIPAASGSISTAASGGASAQRRVRKRVSVNRTTVTAS